MWVPSRFWLGSGFETWDSPESNKHLGKQVVMANGKPKKGVELGLFQISIEYLT